VTGVGAIDLLLVNIQGNDMAAGVSERQTEWQADVPSSANDDDF
jgi:hypothetical protein